MTARPRSVTPSRIVRHELEEVGLEPCLTRMHPRLGLDPRRQLSGDVLELLVGDQARDEELPRLFRGQIVELIACVRRPPREEDSPP